MKFNVRMYSPERGWVCLEVHGRIAWSRRTAMKHLRDVSNDTRFTAYYTEFKIEEN